MIRALQTSIRSNKDVISLDIINHAKQHFFTLKITNNELETLIKNKLNDVIEKLLEANTLLSNEVGAFRKPPTSSLNINQDLLGQSQLPSI